MRSGSSRGCSRRCRRSVIRRGCIGVFRGRPAAADAAAGHRCLRSGTSAIRATSARSCGRPTRSGRPSSHSLGAAPTRPARRRCARRWVRSSACRSSRFDDEPRPRIALVAREARPLEELDLAGATTFVLGAEREGLPETCSPTATSRDDPARAGAESLNVAIAGAIALYEWRRRRARLAPWRP